MICWIISNHWIRLCRIWRILQISQGVIHLGLRPLRITPSLICTILHVLRKPNSIIALLSIQNIFPFFTEEFCHFALYFSAHQNNRSLSPGFLGQRFNNLLRDALLTSFWRHHFNNLQRAAFLTSLVQCLVIAASCEEFCRSRRVLLKYRRHTDPNAGYDQN